MIKKISISQMRSNISKISDEVQFKGVKYIVLKNGKPAIEITPSKKSRDLTVDPSFEKDLEEFEMEYEELLQELANK